MTYTTRFENEQLRVDYHPGHGYVRVIGQNLPFAISRINHLIRTGALHPHSADSNIEAITYQEEINSTVVSIFKGKRIIEVLHPKQEKKKFLDFLEEDSRVLLANLVVYCPHTKTFLFQKESDRIFFMGCEVGKHEHPGDAIIRCLDRFGLPSIQKEQLTNLTTHHNDDVLTHHSLLMVDREFHPDWDYSLDHVWLKADDINANEMNNSSIHLFKKDKMLEQLRSAKMTKHGLALADEDQSS